MAFHRVGNSYYTDDELRSNASATLDLLVPSALTGICIYWLHKYMEVMPFFMEHTTTAKIIYIVTGLTLFSFGYIYRKMILLFVVTVLALGAMGSICMSMYRWLMA